MDTPDGLAVAGVALWSSIAGGDTPKYDLRPDELTVLTAACKTADRLALVEKQWVDLGQPFMSKGSMGQEVTHPLLAEMQKLEAHQARLLGILKLPDDAGVERPNQQRSAAQSRWASHGKGA